MAIHFHEEDLPADVTFAPGRGDRRRYRGDGPDARPRPAVPGPAERRRSGDEHLVRFGPDSDYAAPNLKALLADPERLKLYHFARFDVAIMRAYLGIIAAPLYCTRTASRLMRTYTDRHGLKELVKELLGQDLSKQQQTSDWGAPEISDAQREYAASDVRYLHRLKDELDARLVARKPRRAGPGLFRFPPRAGAARPGRMGRGRHFRAQLTA